MKKDPCIGREKEYRQDKLLKCGFSMNPKMKNEKGVE